MNKRIKIHTIETKKFKTNLVAIFLSTPLSRENVTKDAVLSAVLRRGCEKYKSQEEISKKLEDMYGAEFDSGLDKLGKNHTLKFYIECINDKFIPQNNEEMLKQTIEILSEIVFNSLKENNGFKEEYVAQEKENIKQIIEGKKDNKASYALFRCTEEMYKEKPEGLYRYGYVEDLENINSQNLYEYYINLINNCKIDIFVSGDVDEKLINKEISENENIQKLQESEPIYNINKPNERQGVEKENEIEEKMDVTQGKLVIGYDVEINNNDLEDKRFKYIGMLYNAILGGTANSKLFQNVREKASLAYTANSNFSYYIGNIFVMAGIEIENYKKAVDIIKEQVENMNKGDFSEDDIENAKKIIISNIEGISDEQDTEVIYFLGQELTGGNISLEEYIDFVKEVNKDDIESFAKKVKINTIYFLRN